MSQLKELIEMYLLPVLLTAILLSVMLEIKGAVDEAIAQGKAKAEMRHGEGDVVRLVVDGRRAQVISALPDSLSYEVRVPAKGAYAVLKVKQFEIEECDASQLR